jgi:hypothetical protein
MSLDDANTSAGSFLMVVEARALERSKRKCPIARSVTRALDAIKRYGCRPEQIDQTILAAINVTLCIISGGNDRVAEGFNRDVASSGRGFSRAPRVTTASECL